MEFSKCTIFKDKGRVSVTFQERDKQRKLGFQVKSYHAHATMKYKSELKMNKWILISILLVLNVIWISLSEKFGKGEVFNAYDNYIMPILLITFFMALFFDTLGDLYVVRYVLLFPFRERKRLMIIILNDRQELTVPVRNRREARLIESYILS